MSKPCTCDNCLGSSTRCQLEMGQRLGELWYCRKQKESSPHKANHRIDCTWHKGGDCICQYVNGEPQEGPSA